MSAPVTATLRTRLLDLRGTAASLNSLPTDTEDVVKVALARYLTVRAAGYIEAVRDDVAAAFASAMSSPTVARRVAAHLRVGTGATPGQLCTFVASFHPDWQSQLELYLDADDGIRRSRLGALVAARKKIAHGDGENVTTARALEWSETAQEIGGWLIKRFDPTRAATEAV